MAQDLGEKGAIGASGSTSKGEEELARLRTIREKLVERIVKRMIVPLAFAFSRARAAEAGGPIARGKRRRA